jgi:uncharacterized protein (DUF4415 family)
MNAGVTNRRSETDWARVDALADAEIDTSDIPPLDDAFFARAKLRIPHDYISVTVQVDSDVWAWFQAQGEESENRLNAALRIYAEAHRVYSK